MLYPRQRFALILQLSARPSRAARGRLAFLQGIEHLHVKQYVGASEVPLTNSFRLRIERKFYNQILL